jgi:hypothetical protein
MKINKLHIIGIVCFLLGAASCSTTRNLPEDELLYRGIKKIDVLSQDESGNGEQALEEITAAVTQTTKYGFILPYRLWAYNSFEKYEKGVGKWIFKKIAADPVYLSTVNPGTRTKVASNLLHDYGYFDGKVTYQVDTLKNPKEIKLSYQIDMGKPYYIDTLTYEKFSPFADSLIRRSDSQRLIQR